MTFNASMPAVAPSVPGDEPDPRWWVAPLVGSVVAPVLAVAAAGSQGMWADAPFMLVGSLVSAFALIVPSWFLARTRRRHQRRITLAALGCGLAAGFPLLLATVGWTVLIVMLLTGNVHS
ncbi:hypothetical protein [Streptomyces vilmorinianum]|uniref:hypothetical protein n=1 Tax=Streptomyces vilmorinianum TaxID=3051092 RepID=UPI0010FB7186|nr:hypothetical protein [Streptomyces vilmorinianum]